MTTSSEIKDGYTSTLQDLTFNSKPLISALTILAEENAAHAKEIVEAIEAHLTKVRNEAKLPVLYLIDCIVKNVGGPYLALFAHNIVTTFCAVFEKVDERTRAEMFKLRQTWNDILPSQKLYALDVRIHLIDPAWPVTAAPPSNSIHFNPKFLKATNSQTTKSETPDVATKSITSTILPAAASSLDPETLDMQQKLINKQKELLELQHKKLELELLQAQVKLQEQLKQNTATSVTVAQNLLLKQPTITAAAVSNSLKPKVTYVNSSLINQKLQNNSSGVRIAPVNSSLASAVRPNRDPRLLRQLGNGTNVNSNVQLEIKNNQSVSVDSNNKIVNSKMSVRDNRTEPRLAINKDNDPIMQGKAAKALPRIPLKSSSKHPDSYRKIPKLSRSSKSSNSDGSSSKGSTSSLDSPIKSKIDKGDSSKSRSPIKSPTKHKKKDLSSRNDKKSEKGSKNSKCENRSKSDSLVSATFKELKISTKNRNYIRRNRAVSISPEPSFDVDLRLGAALETESRLQGEAAEDTCANIENSANQNMDVDLRQLPAVISKKRSSTDAIEIVNSKKSKTEILDVLFGNEDTDLRQLPCISPTKNKERPPTPPPPIISNDSRLVDESVEIKVKKESPKVRNFEEIRAKLANATSKSKLSGDLESKDLKSIMSSNVKNKIIISPADEQCIKNGNMTKAQEQALMNKIIAQIENQKLWEAKRIDSEENVGNVSLQPISDEEMDGDFDHDTEDDNKKPVSYSDRDERLATNSSSYMNSDYHKYSRGGGGESRRIGPNWRGRRRQPTGSLPLRSSIRGQRPAVDPWIKPLNNNPHGPWRPMMGQTYPKPLHEPFIQEHDLINNLDGSNSPNAFTNSDTPDLVVDSANQDDIKSINIDGIPRDIRYYDETAVAFMSWDDPREISFQNGSRRVILDEKDVFVLNFNEPYRDITINGALHQIRLGAPTRELYIDGKWYECYFGGPGIGVEIDGKVTVVKLDGPPPQVKIGDLKRTDVVGGKINLIIDAKSIVPVFLDAKVQKFDIDGQIHSLQFIDALRTVLINDVPFKVEFGGLPKPITVHEKKHFIRFSVLPKGIRPGYVNIKDMPGSRLNSPKIENENSQDSYPPVEFNMNINEPALPVLGKKKKRVDSPERNSNSPFQYQNIIQQQNLNNLDVLSSVMASSTPTNPNLSYQVANVAPPEAQPAATNSIPPPLLPANINDLFQKLVATGIITSESVPANAVEEVKAHPKKEKPISVLKPVYFDRIETLKTRQSALITALYSGMQCSSCGMRFPPEQSIQYSQHLDWHFRQNRKGKKNIRKASSRKWYYSLSDWKNYEEIEDLEEKEKNFFDQQQNQGETGNEEPEEEIEIPSVTADPDVQDPHCDICQDKFEQFYNEEKEEWHLRMAVRIDGKTYHPLCYEDYQPSILDNSTEDISLSQDKVQSDEIPGLEVDSETNETPVISVDEIIIDDTDSVVTENSAKPESENNDLNEHVKTDLEDDDDDDDVIIHEVIHEKIILDDDDGKEESLDCSDQAPAPVKKELEDDGFMDVEDGIIKTETFGNIKIKSEPIDPEESLAEPGADEEAEMQRREVSDAPHTEVVASIDGNVEFESGITPSSGISGKIKINITKPLPVINPPKETNKDLASDKINNDKESIDPSQPLPPGEEPVQLYVKPSLKSINLKKLPPVKRGSELTGLCSIM